MQTSAAPTERKSPTEGPYSLWETAADVCIQGRHGKILFRYPLDQTEVAREHVRRLMIGYRADNKRVLKAIEAAFSAMGAAGANTDTEHEFRAAWEACRTVLRDAA